MTIDVEHLFQIYLELAQDITISPIAAGARNILLIIGSNVEGEDFKGKVLPGGADW